MTRDDKPRNFSPCLMYALAKNSCYGNVQESQEIRCIYSIWKQSIGWRSPRTIVCATRMSFLPDLIATIVFPFLRPFPSLLFCNTFIIYCPDYPPCHSHGRIQADSTTVFSQNCCRLPVSCRDAANSEHVFQTITSINYSFTHVYVCYVCICFIRFKN